MQECHVGDALADSATVEGGFAALVVDLFGEGDILPQLQQVVHSLRPLHRCFGLHLTVVQINLPVYCQSRLLTCFTCYWCVPEAC